MEVDRARESTTFQACGRAPYHSVSFEKTILANQHVHSFNELFTGVPLFFRKQTIEKISYNIKARGDAEDAVELRSERERLDRDLGGARGNLRFFLL